MMDGRVNLTVLGDLCLAGPLEDYLLSNPDIDIWEKCGDLVNNRIVIANLENSLSDRGEPKPLKFATLRARPVLVKCLDRLSLAILANNHISDYGDVGAADTVRNLNSAGIRTVGYGANLEDAAKPVILSENGVTVAFVAFSCLSTNGRNYATPSSPGVPPVAMNLLRKRLSELRPLVDGLFVYFHWGVEYDHYPVIDQMRVARRAIDWGADGVFGCHGHVIQPYEFYRGKCIFYGLGNFLFSEVPYSLTRSDGATETGSLKVAAQNKESLAVKLTVKPKGGATNVEVSAVVPVKFGKDYKPYPVTWDSLTVNVSKLNRRTRLVAKFRLGALAGSQDLSYRTRYDYSVFSHLYDRGTIGPGSAKSISRAVARRVYTNTRLMLGAAKRRLLG